MTATWEIPAEAMALTFEDVYRAHREDVLRWALRFGGGRVDWAEDLAHDVFLKLHHRFSAVSASENVAAWLYAVTANEAVSRLRRERSWVTRVARFLSRGDEAAPGPDEAIELSEGARLAMHAVNALPPRERVVLCMAVLDELPQRAIATTLGLSEGYVSKLLTRAKDRVREQGWEVHDDR